jgi:hypothetical protein
VKNSYTVIGVKVKNSSFVGVRLVFMLPMVNNSMGPRVHICFNSYQGFDPNSFSYGVNKAKLIACYRVIAKKSMGKITIFFFVITAYC